MPKTDLPTMTFRPVPALPAMGTNAGAEKASEEAKRVARSAGSSGFADHLRVELAALVAYEMEITVQVGVMVAAGISQTQICHALGIDPTDFKMSKRRLQQVAKSWVSDS